MNNQAEDAGHVVVVGAGIVGVCIGLSLLRDGHRVTLIDRGNPGEEGASFGNAAIIAEDSVVPVATPGIVRRVPAMLADPLGPFALRWPYLPRLAPWLLKFMAASRPARVEAISLALTQLLAGSTDAFMPLLSAAGAPDMIQRSGWLYLYETEVAFQDHQPYLEIQRRRGVSYELMNADDVRQAEPNLAPLFTRGILYRQGAHTINCFRLVQVLAGSFERLGGTIKRADVRGFDVGSDDAGKGRVRAVLCDSGPVPCDLVVIAGGAWSRPLAAALGSVLPLDTERGYHLQLPDPGVLPSRPVCSPAQAFVCTPQEGALRVAGTVELGGLTAPPDWRRAELLRHHAKRWLPALNDAGASRWMGFRPSMPDSLPVIDRSPRHGNAFFAFGHGHLGLTLAARTGQLVAAMLAGRDPGVDMAPYRADRY